MPSATSIQARFWILTIPKEDFSIPTQLKQDWQFIKGQQEVGQSGFEHWQLCIGYSKKVRLGRLKTDFGQRCHAEPTRSEAAEAYVCKEETSVPNTRFSIGTKKLNRNQSEFWDKQWELAKQGNWEDIESDIKIKYYSTLKRIAFDHATPPSNLSSPCGVWIYGPPGVGKSHSAREWHPNLFVKNLNKWWDGYKGEKQVLLDDVGHEHSKWIGWFLKIWADQYVFDGEIKGGTIKIRPEKLIVTSNYTIEELFFFDLALCDAIKRRFYLINIPNKRF